MRHLFEYGKPDVQDRIHFLCVPATMILCDVVLWCQVNGLPCVVSSARSTAKEDRILGRVSKTHLEGRAFDLSLIGWTNKQAKELSDYLFGKYSILGALGADGKSRLVVIHDVGHGNHIHVQVHSKFGLSIPNGITLT